MDINMGEIGIGVADRVARANSVSFCLNGGV